MARRSALDLVIHNPLSRAAASAAGLPAPPTLRRGRSLPSGPVGLASVGPGVLVRDAMAQMGLATTPALVDAPPYQTVDERGRSQPPAYNVRLGALLVDATELRSLPDLEQVRAVLRPAMRGLEGSGRVVIVASAPAADADLETTTVAAALDGLVRTVGKELRRGATANLVRLEQHAGVAELVPVLRFLLEGRSAYVDGQVITVAAAGASEPGEATSYPLRDRLVVVTGAARGIGAEIARVAARDGATVVAVDIPAAGDALARVANEVGGSALQLDITREDAGERIAGHVTTRHGASSGIWALVHNAGITRDKMLANLDEARWASVLEVNLLAQMRINETLLDVGLPGGMAQPGRIIGVASTSGLAGNKGQANYAASKAGVAGYVRALATTLADRGITVNAVAPGFIETEMTAAIPALQREVYRRVSSLQQGGKPVDVAETIAWLADPANAGINGLVLRVCGQNIVGA